VIKLIYRTHISIILSHRTSEFANVIVVSKAAKILETGNGKKLKEIEALLGKLNPKAKIIIPRQNKYSDLDISKTIINTGLFDMAESQSSLGWAQELLKEEHTPETEEYGISSLAFIAKNMPFHPTRLAAILRGFGDYDTVIKTKDKEKEDGIQEEYTSEFHNGDVFKGVVRTKGHIWLANANAYPVHFQSAGAQIDMRPDETPFLVEVKEKLARDGFADDFSPEERATLTNHVVTRHKKLKEDGLWTEKYGDRRSQLVFIGVGLDKAKMKTWLTQALITEEESAAMGGMSAWKKLADPFYGGKLADAHFSINP
jgi:G3E family GTPase